MQAIRFYQFIQVLPILFMIGVGIYALVKKVSAPGIMILLGSFLNLFNWIMVMVLSSRTIKIKMSGYIALMKFSTLVDIVGYILIGVGVLMMLNKFVERNNQVPKF